MSPTLHRFTAVGCLIAAIALATSCAKENPSDATPPPGAMFEEETDYFAYPPNCTVPMTFVLTPSGGSNCLLFENAVTIRDVNGNLAPAGSTVTLTFPDDPNYVIPTQPYHDIVAGLHRWLGSTNEFGVATFRIKGAFKQGVPLTPPANLTASVYFREWPRTFPGPVFIELGDAKVSTPDLNNSGGVNAADQSIFMHDMFAGPAGYCTRSDFNGDGFVNGADYSILLSVQFNSCQQ